ncbi:MAG: hypothetical protein IGR76_05205 [Synechococcales cyanobacterium T60_A2020_003]|nr:hypothetical protein [Synechococcales cyanobacterium T60_A2020_003]
MIRAPRLSPLEQTIMYWLALNREWTAIATLQDDIVPGISRANLLEALESLVCRSLIETRVSHDEATSAIEYTQQPVIMEYVPDHFIQQLVAELLEGHVTVFSHYAILKTTVLDYIRDSQIRLILHPISEQLCQTVQHTNQQLEPYLRSLLSALRSAPEAAVGYGIGNFINQ